MVGFCNVDLAVSDLELWLWRAQITSITNAAHQWILTQRVHSMWPQLNMTTRHRDWPPTFLLHPRFRTVVAWFQHCIVPQTMLQLNKAWHMTPMAASHRCRAPKIGRLYGWRSWVSVNSCLGYPSYKGPTLCASGNSEFEHAPPWGSVRCGFWLLTVWPFATFR